MMGGCLFFLSWILQAWETKQKGQSIVSMNFFIIRLIACIILLIEAIFIKSFGFILLMGGTIVLISYNITVIMRKNRKKDHG